MKIIMATNEPKLCEAPTLTRLNLSHSYTTDSSYRSNQQSARDIFTLTCKADTLQQHCKEANKSNNMLFLIYFNESEKLKCSHE